MHRASWLSAAVIGTAIAIAGCAGSGTSQAPAASATTSVGASQAPEASTLTGSQATATPMPSVSPSHPRGTLIVHEARGLRVTLPPDWLGIASGDARNAAKIAALRAVSPEQAKRVDALISALEKHPEYWFAAMRTSDEAVLVAQLREFDGFDAWRKDQLAALEKAYGKVAIQYVKVPRDGWSYSWHNNGLYFELVAFERRGGAALFTFGGRPTSNGLPALWDEAFATFTDSGA